MGNKQNTGFEDIRSTTSGVQEKPDWFSEARPTASEAARRRQAERRAQRESPRRKKRKPSSQKNSPPPRRRESGDPRPRGRPPAKERPRKKPMSLFKRRLLMILVLLAMILGTGFLAESLLFRVTTVRVTGDMPYDEEQILSICGFKTGDNLLLIPAADREKRLEAQLPYISKAKITRHIPGTVEINLTAAQGICCIEVGGQWYVVASGGKVLEESGEPKAGLMQVVGITAISAKVGEDIELEEGEASAAFLELLGTMGKLGEEGEASKGFTKMDLTNLYDIRVWYQDRVECLMGSASQLEYKLRWAYGNLTDLERGIGQEETGVLDLTYLPTKKASYFTAGATAATPGPDGTAPAAPEVGSSEPTPTPTPGRGGDIPDGVFTG